VAERLVRLPLLGPVLAILLHQRGELVLHGSAVACDAGAVGFLGAKGRGKSTLAASLYARGHTLVSDDVLVVTAGAADERIEGDRLGGRRKMMLQPGFPQLKLCPDAVSSCLRTDPDTLTRIVPGGVKVAYPTRPRFATRPVPLLGIFVVDDGEQPGIAPLSPGEAVVELVRHSHGTRFGQGLLQGPEAARHLRGCVSLASAVPVQRLIRPPCLQSLPILARIVEEAALSAVRGEPETRAQRACPEPARLAMMG
jgi:hypothetical protein